MKTIKVFALPSHVVKERMGGVDFARVVQPMSYLDGYSNGKYKFKVDIYDIEQQEKFNWTTVSDKYDLVFLNYTVLDWAYAAMGTFVHGKGKKIIMDVDDALWHVNPDNPVYKTYQERHASTIISAILDDVDGITTTSMYLKHLIISKTHADYDKVRVFPNAVDLKYYDHKTKAQDRTPITLFHYGSTTHFSDLSSRDFIEGIDKVLKAYPNVVFKTVGAYMGKLKMKWGSRYNVAYGDPDIYKWIKLFKGFMDEADIMVVPLTETVYNKCKSDIKFLESATAVKPGVWQKMRQYEETIVHGETGYLARTPDEWYESIKELVDSKEKRQEVGQNAYNYVTKERQIKELIPGYADFLIKILTS